MRRAGGHLAKSAATGDLLLRESAQCPEAEEGDFQDVAKFKYFNTNNLWVSLESANQSARHTSVNARTAGHTHSR